MFDNSGVPYVGKTHLFYFQQGLIINMIELANSIFFYRSIEFIPLVGVSKQPWQELINGKFIVW